MDINGGAYAGEICFVDGLHSRTKGYKTISLWTRHELLNKIIMLASMDCEHENTDNLTRFFNFFNEACAEVKGDPNYKFNPSHIVCDAAGANVNGIRAAFGEDMQDRIAFCQKHYDFNLDRVAQKFPTEQLAKQWMDIGRRLYRSATVEEYTRNLNAQLLMAEDYPHLKLSSWIDWWDDRKVYFVDVWRGLGVDRMNKVETGNVTLRAPQSLSLIDGVYRDAGLMFSHQKQYELTVTGVIRCPGRGPTQDEQNRRAGAEQSMRMQQYMRDMASQDFADPEEQQPVFVPAHHARHRTPNYFPQCNPTQGNYLQCTSKYAYIVSFHSNLSFP